MLKIIPEPKEIIYMEGEVGDGLFIITEPNIPKEGYELYLNEKGITIYASDKEGVFYAQKSLEQIIAQCEKLPCVVVKDAPKYSYRGFMLDCSRHFFTVEEILKQIDVLADLKINKFHWHLTDDQGWRIEIEEYPDLVNIGSKRYSTRKDNLPVTGYYTKSDIRKVVSYCSERFIEVIPELDMPGHFTAAIASYPFLGCENKQIKVSEHFGIHSDIACAGKESTYIFIKKVLEEIIELFPSDYIHLGGDEALKLKWINCPDCQKTIKEKNLKDEEELQGAFLSEIIKFINSRGKKAILWNDGLLGGNISGNYTVQYWKESKRFIEVTNKEAAKGRKVIYSPFFSFYLDYPCGMTPLKKVYNYKNKISDEAISGMEAPLWTEYVPNVKQLEFMTYPRLAAFAERAWSTEINYFLFIKKLNSFLSYLNNNDIDYNNNYNPTIFGRILETAKFFINAYDSTLKEASKEMLASKKAWNKKYK